MSFEAYGQQIVDFVRTHEAWAAPIVFALGSLLSLRVRSRAALVLELVALRHQLTVLRRQHPGPHHRYERRAA